MTGRKRNIDDLAGEIQELFADMWQVPRFSAGLRQGYRPQADCYRTEDPPTLTVVLELPGVDPASVEVVVSGRTLTVNGDRERPRIAGARYLAMEIEYGWKRPGPIRLIDPRHQHPAGAVAPQLDLTDGEIEPRAGIIRSGAGRSGSAG